MKDSLASRRIRIFFSQRRSVVSAWFLIWFSFFSLTAEIWSNDCPVVMSYHGHVYMPALVHYPARAFGIKNREIVDFKNLRMGPEDWAVWPVNRWSPYAINKSVSQYPAPPSAQNWLGTDDRGRDVFARLLYGFRYSLIFAVGVWFVSALGALAFGGTTGFIGGKVDLYGQRLVEILSTIPQLLLLIYIVSLFGSGMAVLVGLCSAFGWIGLSGFVRAEVLRTRNLESVEAARALGASRWHVFFAHVLPNSLVPLFTFAPFMIVGNVGGLVALDYMGLGLPPPTPSWGELLEQAETYFSYAWWLATFPSVVLFLTLLALTLFGDGVRLAWDPMSTPSETIAAEAKRHRLREWIASWRKPALQPARRFSLAEGRR